MRYHLYIFFHLVFFILLFACTPLLSQDYLSRQLDYANNLYENELYFDAITEFKRLQFFDKYKLHEYDANLKIAFCYKYGGYFDEAVKYFAEAETSARNKDEKLQVKFQIIRSNILRKTFPRAFQLLNELESSDEFFGIANEINYWRGWAYMLSDDWESASIEFSQIDYNHPLKQFSDRTARDKYSVTFTKVISYILPGFGQFYTGNFVSGLMSLAWNGLWGYLTVNAFVEDRAFDGITIGSLLWMRFYRGNIQNSEKHAIEENLKISNKALRYLENSYEGNKP